jgi:hypothetical protein
MVGAAAKTAIGCMIAFARSLIDHDENDDAGRWLDDSTNYCRSRHRGCWIPTNRLPANCGRGAGEQGQPEQAVAVLQQLVPSPLPP